MQRTGDDNYILSEQDRLTDKKLTAIGKIHSLDGPLNPEDKKFLYYSHGYASQLKMYLFQGMNVAAGAAPAYQITRTMLSFAPPSIAGGVFGIAGLILWQVMFTMGSGATPIEDAYSEANARMGLHRTQRNGLRLFASRRHAEHSMNATRTDSMLIAVAVAILASANDYRLLEAFAVIALLNRAYSLWDGYNKDFYATTKYEIRR